MSFRVGEVHWYSPIKGKRVAYLNADGSWDMPSDPEFAETLADVSGSKTYGPADGPFGPRQLKFVAGLLDGQYEVYPTRPAPDGVVY